MKEKIRYDLVPAHGIKEISRVLTRKLDTYEENQWKKGMKWTEVLSSLKKHLNEFEMGNDYTEEGLLNIAEVANNALILCEFYHIYPQGDDRIMAPTTKPIVALDLDNVIFDFNGAYEAKFGTKMNPYWKANYEMSEHLKQLEKDKDFWVNIPILHKPCFEVDYYITARNIPVEWIEESLQKNGLPCAPVHVVPWDQSKLAHLRDLKIDIFIDDKVKYFCSFSNENFIYLYKEFKTNICYENRKISKPNTNFGNL